MQRPNPDDFPMTAQGDDDFLMAQRAYESHLMKLGKPVDIGHELKVHTPTLLGHVFDNPGTEALLRPFQVFGRMLNDVAIRASQLNDPILNDLMMRLTLYEVADPEKPTYDPIVIARVHATAQIELERIRAEQATINHQDSTGKTQ